MLRPGGNRPVVMSVERAVVDAFGLEEDHRIIVFDRGDQQPLGVIGRGRDHRLQSRHMGEDALRRLAVGLPAEDAAAKGRAYGDGGSELACRAIAQPRRLRSEEHTSELQSLMRISYAVFCLKKKKNK